MGGGGEGRCLVTRKSHSRLRLPYPLTQCFKRKGPNSPKSLLFSFPAIEAETVGKFLTTFIFYGDNEIQSAVWLTRWTLEFELCHLCIQKICSLKAIFKLFMLCKRSIHFFYFCTCYVNILMATFHFIFILFKFDKL